MSIKFESGCAIAIVLLILFFVILVTIGPLFSIWSLNCLFGLNIPINVYTYFSALWLGIMVYGSSGGGK